MRSRQVVERVLQRQAEVLLVERLPELGPDRLRHLVGDHLQPGRKRVAGLERARDQVERLGELLLERAQAARALHLQDRNGIARANRAANQPAQRHRDGEGHDQRRQSER